MTLSEELISQFVKATKDSTEPSKETVVYGTVVYDGKPYVKFDGSDLLTPISTTTDVKDGERVTVMVKNHTAIVTGNISSPAARTDDVKKTATKIDEFENVMAHKVTTEDLEAVNGNIDNLIAKLASISKLDTAQAEIDDLRAEFADLTYVNADEINALTAKIESVEAIFGTFTDVSTEDLEALNAEIATLKGYTASFTYVSAEVLEAVRATVKQLDVDKLSAKDADFKYVNIDFANIDKAWMEEFYAKSGLINYVVSEDVTVTGYLVGVTIKGDIIEGGTIVADKLVIQGDDGLYYKLNTNGETVQTEQTDRNSLNGSVITAKSITAEKVSITDLVAFGATIGGFKITDNAIHSGVKSSVHNTTRGVYLDNDGQFALGDSNQFLRYFIYEEARANIVDDTLVITEQHGGTFSTSISDGVLHISAGNLRTPSLDIRIVDHVFHVNSDAYKLEISAESLSFGANSKKTGADLKALTEYVKIETVVDEETGDEKPCIELSEDDSDNKQVITNVKNTFIQGDTVKTEVGVDGVKTTNLTANGTITHGALVWEFRANGNCGLSWKEVTS